MWNLNDLAMMGAKPKYLTCSVIIEEGFEVEQLEIIVNSMKEELTKNEADYRDWETDRKSTRLNSSHITRPRMPSSA